MAIMATTESGHQIVLHSKAALAEYRREVEAGQAEALQRTYHERLTPSTHRYLHDQGQCYGQPCSLAR